MKKEYRDILTFPAALLYKKDLFTLEEILKDSQQNITNTIRIKLTDKDIHFEVDSFEELFNCQNLPKSTDELNIHCLCWVEIDGRRDVDRGVSLTLHHNYIHCQIHSFDEDWYRGKSSRLNSFFKQKRPWYTILNKIYPFFIGIAPWILLYTIYLFKLRNYIVAVFSIALFISISIIYILAYQGKVFPYVKIILSEKPKFKIGWNEIFTFFIFLSSVTIIFEFIYKVIIKIIRYKNL